jgi:hypothetical protein
MLMKRFVYLLVTVATALLFLFVVFGLKGTFNLYPTVSGEQAKQDIEQGRATKIIATEGSDVIRLYYPASEVGEQVKILADRTSLAGLRPPRSLAIDVERKPSWTPIIQVLLFILVGIGLAAVASRVLSRR